MRHEKQSLTNRRRFTIIIILCLYSVCLGHRRHTATRLCFKLTKTVPIISITILFVTCACERVNIIYFIKIGYRYLGTFLFLKLFLRHTVPVLNIRVLTIKIFILLINFALFVNNTVQLCGCAGHHRPEQSKYLKCNFNILLCSVA